jgi:hypothetical protein
VNIGFCGLDKARSPLAGDEIRSCWEPSAAALDRSGPGDQPAATDADQAPGGVDPLNVPLPVVTPPASPRFDLSFFVEPEI